MGLDISLCIVPKQIDTLITKAKANTEYAEWMAFVPTLLKEAAIDTRGDPIIKQVTRDVREMKQHYRYSKQFDHFDDPGRVSASLDHLLDIIIDETGSGIPKQILWKGGQPICDHCNGVQGLPVRLYTYEEIKNIHLFLQSIDEKKLLSYYNYERMLESNVYKATDPDRKNLLASLFGKLKEFMARAYNEQQPVLKAID